MNDLVKVIRSFRFAFNGIKYTLFTQHNMRFHFMAAVIILILSRIFHLSKNDLLWLLVAITVVIVTELMNTAVEKTIDLAMPQNHPVAGIAKDVSAASVLVSAVFAVIVALTVLFPPMFHTLRQISLVTFVLQNIQFIILIVLFIALIQGIGSRQFWIRPDVWTSFAFAVSTWMAGFTGQSGVAVFSYILAFMVLGMRYNREHPNLFSLLFGALLGIIFAWALHL